MPGCPSVVGQGWWRMPGDTQVSQQPQPEGVGRVLPAPLVPEEPPRPCPCVLLERPHCSHSSVSTLRPEPCGQRLPLISRPPEQPRRAQTLPEAFTSRPAAGTTSLFGVGERNPPTRACGSQGPSPRRHTGTNGKAGTGSPPSAEQQSLSCSYSPWEAEQAPARPLTANYCN